MGNLCYENVIPFRMFCDRGISVWAEYVWIGIQISVMKWDSFNVFCALLALLVTPFLCVPLCKSCWLKVQSYWPDPGSVNCLSMMVWKTSAQKFFLRRPGTHVIASISRRRNNRRWKIFELILSLWALVANSALITPRRLSSGLVQ